MDKLAGIHTSTGNVCTKQILVSDMAFIQERGICTIALPQEFEVLQRGKRAI